MEILNVNASFKVEPKVNENIDNRLFSVSLSDWQLSRISGVNSAAKCQFGNFNKDNDKTNNETFCSAVWDSVYCWPPTPSGTIVAKQCSDIFKDMYPNLAVHLEEHARKECLANGTWSQGNASNYAECANSVRSYLEGFEGDDFLFPMAHYILFIGSIFSLACLGISLAIFYKFRCLQCDRVTVHVHLMLSLILRFVFMFVITEPYVLGHTSSFRDVEILCESILVLFLFSTFASVSWMFNEGLFLNLSLMVDVITISPGLQFTIYYITGWGVPTAFVVAYAISMHLKEQKSCWNGYSDMKEIWILHGPIMFELVVIGIFLVNILRVLNKKIRNSHTRAETSKLKAAAKATAILFPVLGINNLVLFYNPGGGYNKYFVALNSFFGSTQGVLVSIIYCFTNKEVCAAIQRSLHRRNTRRGGNVDPTRIILQPGITLARIFSRRPRFASADV